MNYYEILEVSQNASQEVIKAAYKSLMQRYHPDKNPGNAEIAKHALLVRQAFDVLSDSNKRAAYDSKLKQQSSDHLNIKRGKGFEVQDPASKGQPLEKVSSESNWFPLLLVGVLLAFLIFIAIQRNHIEEQRAFNEAYEKLKTASEKADAEKDVIKKEKELAARTVSEFAVNITVHLKNKYQYPLEDSGRVLSIPVLGIRVGESGQDKVLNYIENNKELITRKLESQLAYADHAELIKIDGEQYLKRTIQASLNGIVGTNDPYVAGYGYPMKYYGVEVILLPKSFIVR